METPRHQNSYSLLLVGLRQQTQQFCQDGFKTKQTHSSLEMQGKLAQLISKMSTQECIEFFDQYHACNTIVSSFTSVFNAVLEANESDPKALKEAFDYLKHTGVILSRLFTDCYLIEPIVSQFNKSATFLKSIMLLLSSNDHLTKLASTLKMSQDLVRIFSKVLLKLLHNEQTALVFVDLKGVQQLKLWLQLQGDAYLNCLSMIVPLCRVNTQIVEDFCDLGIDKLLQRHTLQAKSNHQLYYKTLLVVCQKSDLQVNVQLLNLLVKKVSVSRDLHGTILLAHVDCCDKLIKDRAIELIQQHKQAEEGQKVMIQNQIDQFDQWVVLFGAQSKMYKQYTQHSTTLVQNTFDDDLVEEAMLGLGSLFGQSVFGRQLCLQDRSCLHALVQCMGSKQSYVTLSLLLQEDVGQDIQLKIIRACKGMDSLNVLSMILKGAKAQDEVRLSGMLEFCLQHRGELVCTEVVRLAVLDHMVNSQLAGQYQFELKKGVLLNGYLQILTQIAKHQPVTIHDVYQYIDTTTEISIVQLIAELSLPLTDQLKQLTLDCVSQRTSLQLCGQTCLLIKRYPLVLTEQIMREVVLLTDLSQLQNQFDLEGLEEVSFYALQALIALISGSAKGQQMAKDNHAIGTLLRLLRSGTYQTKKTVCYCLHEIVNGNGPNQKHAIASGAVPVLTELINDDDDCELSEHAFDCLEALGPKVITELVKYLDQAVDRVEGVFAKSKTIIVDIYKGRERHLFLKPTVPNLRHVGPQDKDDLIDLNVYASLQKILPVLNGLLQSHPITEQGVQSIITLFSRNLPIDIYHTAILTLHTSLQQTSKVDVVPLCQFTIGLANLPAQCYLIDCCVKPNPDYNDNIEERTIQEMQLTIFEQQLYEVQGSKMVHNGVQIHDPSILFKHQAFIDYVLEVRTLVYSCLNVVFASQDVLEFCARFKYLTRVVCKDVMMLPKVLEVRQGTEQEAEFNSEALELYRVLVANKGVVEIMRGQGINEEWMQALDEAVARHALGFGI